MRLLNQGPRTPGYWQRGLGGILVWGLQSNVALESILWLWVGVREHVGQGPVATRELPLLEVFISMPGAEPAGPDPRYPSFFPGSFRAP